MEVVIAGTEQQCGMLGADIVANAVAGGAATAVPGGATLGLATGSSPLTVYRELIRRHHEQGLSFVGARAFLLDEYVGLAPGHPQSYARVIRTEFVDHVDFDPQRVHGPDGNAGDLAAAAAAYEQLLTAHGPVDVQLLGIGSNGHIGFNEPMSSLNSRTRVALLTEQTRRDNARFFGAADEVPRHVLTQGLATIRQARHLVLIATGAHKAAAVAAAVEGPLAARCPASVLQLHPQVTIVLDDAAAQQLEYAEFYRYATAFTDAGASRAADRAGPPCPSTLRYPQF